MESVRKYSLQKSTSYAYNSYGEAAANKLALLWVSKMEHLLTTWMENDEAYEFKDFDMASWQPGGEFSSFSEDMPASSKFWQRVQQVRAIRPGKPARRAAQAAASDSKAPRLQ